MDDLILRASFGDDLEIWISDVSRDTFDANELDDLGTDFGYFVMTGNRKPGGNGARILAKAASAQTAIELFGILTSRTKRCAVLAEEHGDSSLGEVAQFPVKRESRAAKAATKKSKKSAAIAPSKSAKPDVTSPKTRRASPTPRLVRGDDLPSKPHAQRKRECDER